MSVNTGMWHCASKNTSTRPYDLTRQWIVLRDCDFSFQVLVDSWM